MSYMYRYLRTGDVALLKALLGVFGTAFQDAVTYGSNVPSDAYLTRLLANEHFIAVVAIVDGEVIGGLAAYQLDKFEQDRREIYIYDLAVLSEHRRKGVATGRCRGSGSTRPTSSKVRMALAHWPIFFGAAVNSPSITSC